MWGWIRTDFAVYTATTFLRFVDLSFVRRKCVLIFDVRMRDGSVQSRMGEYGCVMEAYEHIRMHTDDIYIHI